VVQFPLLGLVPVLLAAAVALALLLLAPALGKAQEKLAAPCLAMAGAGLPSCALRSISEQDGCPKHRVARVEVMLSSCEPLVLAMPPLPAHAGETPKAAPKTAETTIGGGQESLRGRFSDTLDTHLGGEKEGKAAEWVGGSTMHTSF
jgi:hypothetical protein